MYITPQHGGAIDTLIAPDDCNCRHVQI